LHDLFLYLFSKKSWPVRIALVQQGSWNLPSCRSRYRERTFAIWRMCWMCWVYSISDFLWRNHADRIADRNRSSELNCRCFQLRHSLMAA
jgi:hypothetical protein